MGAGDGPSPAASRRRGSRAGRGGPRAGQSAPAERGVVRSRARSGRTADGRGPARPLDEIKQVRSVLGGTVNDVVLTAITRGFRDLLLGRDEELDGVVVRTLVPVSLRPRDDHSLSNQVSAMIAELPVGIEDPVARLTRDPRADAGLKESHQAVAGTALTGLAGLRPAGAARAGVANGDGSDAAGATAIGEHGDDQRARSPAAALRVRPRDARVLPVRAGEPRRAHRRRDPVVQPQGRASASRATGTRCPTSRCSPRASRPAWPNSSPSRPPDITALPRAGGVFGRQRTATDRRWKAAAKPSTICSWSGTRSASQAIPTNTLPS